MALLGKILGIGIPSAVGMVVMAIAELVLLGLVNGFGSEATAAYGAVNQIMGYAQFTAISISISVSILGAQAIGGGHAGRLDAIVRTGLLLNLVLTGGLVALIYLFPRAVLASSLPTPPCSNSRKDCSSSPCGVRCRSAWRRYSQARCARAAWPWLPCFCRSSPSPRSKYPLP